MEKELALLVERLRQAGQNNLVSVILYGSGATGEYRKKHSDLNVLCLVARLEASDLAQLAPAFAWWIRRGHVAPLVFAREELVRAADIYAIELLDMKSAHRVLWGEDALKNLDVPMTLHAQQVERDLRNALVRLRESALAAGNRERHLRALVVDSVSSFAALFRHALIALGKTPPATRRETFDQLAATLGFDAAPFHAALDVRDGKRKESQMDAANVFAAYLASVTKATEEMDARLASK